MINEIQHHLVHARDLAQAATQLFARADDTNDPKARDALFRTAHKLLEQADRLLEDTD